MFCFTKTSGILHGGKRRVGGGGVERKGVCVTWLIDGDRQREVFRCWGQDWDKLRMCSFVLCWEVEYNRFSRSSHFLSRTSQGHNALPRPGLEPGSSDSEPSALTTGLLDKAVALTCPRYSWPRMLKVTPCTFVRSYIQIFLAWCVTIILYDNGATLCELRYQFP